MKKPETDLPLGLLAQTSLSACLQLPRHQPGRFIWQLVGVLDT